MNELTIFENENFGEVRTMMIDGEPWFVASDVCKVLGIAHSNRALKALYEEEKGVRNADTPGGTQQFNIISESGLYHLMFEANPKMDRTIPMEERLKKVENLKRFRLWVTHDVIPSIRKHGAYMTPKTIDDILKDPREMARLLLELAEERDKVKQLETENQIKDQQIVEMQPKATYYDMVLQSTSLLSTTEIAKDFRMTAQELNNFLEEHGIQFKRHGVWLLYKKYAERGYTQTKTYTYNNYSTSIHTYWTQAGRLFIYELLKQNGILPTVELE